MSLNYLQELEAESIYIFREVAAQFDRPVLLFSGGKDSICLVHLALKAFRPGKLPFPLLHIDTGHNFFEVLEFRDHLALKIQEQLIVRTVDDAIAKGITQDSESEKSRNWLQIPTLLAAIEEFKFNAAIGGARRDEEKARAKERIFSFRDSFGGWDPKNQRPELWNIFNGEIFKEEHFRVFPLSNWTELDIWRYIEKENIPLPSIYFSHRREVFYRDGQWLSASPLLPLKPGEKTEFKNIRYRTVGDLTCTGAVVSEATSVAEIILEIEQSTETERGSRADDKKTWSSMEDRKKMGYF